MKRKHLFAGFCGLLAAIAVVAAPKTAYVVTLDGRKVAMRNIEATASGAIKLTDRNGQTLTWQRGKFRSAYVPEPAQVDALDKLLEAKEYDKVVKFSPEVFQKYAILGWGDKIAYLEGSAYLGKKDPVKAAAAFAKGKGFDGSYKDEVARGRVLAMLAQGKVDEVRDDLSVMVRSSRKADAAMALNARGQILAKEGKSKEAVLEYLKTLLLFESDNKSVKPFRDDARKQVVALMRKMGDPKWRMFVDIE